MPVEPAISFHSAEKQFRPAAAEIGGERPPTGRSGENSGQFGSQGWVCGSERRPPPPRPDESRMQGVEPHAAHITTLDPEAGRFNRPAS